MQLLQHTNVTQTHIVAVGLQEMIEGRFEGARCSAQLHGGATWEEVRVWLMWLCATCHIPASGSHPSRIMFHIFSHILNTHMFIHQVVGDCLALHAIARNLRAARHANGALRLDNARLTFSLDKDGNPVGGRGRGVTCVWLRI